MKASKLFIFFLFCILSFAHAQPANDNCTNANTISIANSGFGFGTFFSAVSNVTNATVQAGETFAPSAVTAGLNKKSVWFKFTLPTTRSVRITLQQTGTGIGANDIGFAVYKTNNCLPSNTDITTEFTPVTKFAGSYHPCVKAGDYLVQVSANNYALGSVKIRLTTSDSLSAQYDHPANALPFGLLSPGIATASYSVECQSLEDAGEICAGFNIQKYNKSTWHTFTTPAYFDYIAIAAAHNLQGVTRVIGYRLYKGDGAVVPVSSLSPVGVCDSILSDGYHAGYKLYTCSQLLANTTYTIQLFFEESFKSNLTLSIDLEGAQATKAPQPLLAAVPLSNKLGILPNGVSNATDVLACNSRHSQHTCGQALPAGGLLFGGSAYNLSSFFTFTLSQYSQLSINSSVSGGPALLLRLYRQGLTANCASLQNSQLLDQTKSSINLFCVAPGDYVLQVSGQDSIYSPGIFTPSLLSNLGAAISVSLDVTGGRAANIFSLNAPGAYDQINNMQPLQSGASYTAATDTFGCAKTVRPAGNVCDTSMDRAIYREFVIADSGILTMNSINFFNNKLYKGDANALATVQGAFSYPATIAGLPGYTLCFDNNTGCIGHKVCVTPDVYTFAGFGNDKYPGLTNHPIFSFDKINTTHNSLSAAQNIGNIIDTLSAHGGTTVVSDADYFTCHDNAIPINGYTPCAIGGHAATKAIYRQFYLSKTTDIAISGEYADDCGGITSGGLLTLFYGQATSGAAGLSPVGGAWQCFTSAGAKSCKPLPAGWYTLISYGSGPVYANPVQNVNERGYGSYIGVKDQVKITIIPPCDTPRYNHPYTAAIDSITHQPFLIKWMTQAGSTAAYPLTGTRYTLPAEHFNCTVDTPFSHPLSTCGGASNRIAYYLFKTTQVSYLQIDTKGFWGELFNKDIRADSMLFGSIAPVQPCLRSAGAIQVCSLQPGTYTLILFAGDNDNCSSVSPQIYIDQVGASRFDFAAKAYDFGIVKPDSLFHFGKTGDVNPLNAARAPSDDFFYCTTGSSVSDPADAICGTAYNANIYQPGSNIYMFDINNYNGLLPRRNLWYTFVVKEGGYVRVKVKGHNGYQNRFAVYESDVNALLPFSAVVAGGLVDSTLSQGLILITKNQQVATCTDGDSMVTFFRDPCAAMPVRYYILADGIANSQADVAIAIDSVSVVQPIHDHYFQAADMGLLAPGSFAGPADNYACATADVKDPSTGSCAPKTLWYRFTTAVTGHINFSLVENGVHVIGGANLYRQTIAGDSTAHGLMFVSDSACCISPGTYYLVTTGCGKFNQSVHPEITIAEEAGDFCHRPVVAGVSAAGTYTATAIVDCHTIGTDYGEFGSTITCPVNAATSQYKTSWFRIDVSGSDTLDITTFLTTNTNASQADIHYRLMTGDCSAMQEGSCVQDSRTQDTYKCLANGSYFIQVFTPVVDAAHNAVTGNVQLHLVAVSHSDTCAPLSGCLATAAFVPKFDCRTDRVASFNNYSTYGTSITYQWNFGYASQTSTSVSPTFHYPALSADSIYNIRLIVTNTLCAKSDTAFAVINVPGRPEINLPNDTLLCKPGVVLLNVSSWPGALYAWQDGAIGATYTATDTGAHSYNVQVSYNGCVSADTIVVNINPGMAHAGTTTICPGDSILLKSIQGHGELYKWNTGSVDSFIYARAPGVYYNDVTYVTCQTRDSFIVKAPVYPFASPDSTVCLLRPFILNAPVPLAGTYLWNDGSANAFLNISAAGLYYVDISFVNSHCTVRDSVNIKDPAVVRQNLAAIICQGNVYIAPWGATISTTGIYTNTLRYVSGCDSVITVLNVDVQTPAISAMQVAICAGSSYVLPWGPTVSAAGIYSDTLHYLSGCDSLIISVDVSIKNVTRFDTLVSICSGQSYILPWGLSVSTAGIYRDTVRYSSGCDSLLSAVSIALYPISNTVISKAICTGDTYILPGGLFVNTAGIYRDTLHTINGCDSIFIVNLTINSASTSTTAVAICPSAMPYVWNGIVYTNAGTFTQTLVNANGCDSIATLVLTIKPNSAGTTNIPVCASQMPYTWNGSVYTSAGTFTKILIAANGCDSVATLVLTIKPSAASTTNVLICASQIPYMWNGNSYISAGTFTKILIAANGCDSVARLALTIKPNAVSATIVSICASQMPYVWNGNSYTSAGTFTKILIAANGCDSVATLVLTIKPSAASTTNVFICASQIPYMWNGNSYISAGTFTKILIAANGCDSVATLVLAIKPNAVSTTIVSICASQMPYMWNGNSYTSAGTFTKILIAANSCDSIATLVLKVFSNTTSTSKITVCASQLPYYWNGSPYGAAGTFTHKLINANGCDSVATLVLSVSQSSGSVTKISVCPSQLPYHWNGDVYNITGTFIKILRNAAGCDSLTSLALTVKATTFDTTSVAVCSDQLPYIWNGNSYNAAGVFTKILVNSVGCDSGIILKLAVNIIPAIPVIISNSPVCTGNALLLHASSAGGSTYLWTTPAGLTVPKQDFEINNVTLNDSGKYYVTATSGNCSSTANNAVSVLASPLVSIGSTIQLYQGDSTMLSPVVSGINPGFKWTPDFYISSNAIKNPVIYGVSNIIYTLTVTSNGMCPVASLVNVKVLSAKNALFIPNSFSPNNDGVNDTWDIKALAFYPEATVNVYSRYGQNVYTAVRGYSQPWTGKSNGQNLPAGVYYYVIVTNPKAKPVSGWVALIK